MLNPNTGASLGSVSITGTVFSSGTPFPGEINGIDLGVTRRPLTWTSFADKQLWR